MGIETAAILAFTAAKAYSEVSTARKDAKGVVKQAGQEALTSAQATQQKVSSAKVSFLNSGFTLEGTPEMSLKGILNAGYQDVSNIATNANTKSKNIVSAARTKALMSLGQAGLSAGMGGGDISAINSTAIPGTSTVGGWSSTPYSGSDITWTKTWDGK